MKQNLYVVYDSCAKVSMPPFSSPNDDVAKRDFVIGAFQAMKPLQDLQLWRVAEISAPDGVVEGFAPALRESRELINPTVSEIAVIKQAYTDFFENPYADSEHHYDDEKEVVNE